ncbi:hypothetical protein THRCLA_10550 [Thraustotheca clavata]|uniref:Succinylglutamate desuccinylase/Aspartoacylase catalytic domain-containing protein n=1 Tax=Thraustotheca clavata TaxID=74557 RepID=A0A1V9YL53_9STRA|nr:hypothetical protein THRCLA_10550 [Thraustotheca clavata]
MFKEIGNHIWQATGRTRGKNVTILGGVHGNELSGVQVIEMIKQKCPPLISGSLTLILGNPKANEINSRGSEPHADLNRCFTVDVESTPPSPPFIYEETRAREIAPYIRQSDVMLDLHATNKPSIPFLKLTGILSEHHFNICRWFPCSTILHDVHYKLAGKIALSDEYAGAHNSVGLIYESGLASDTSTVIDMTNSVLHILSQEAKIIELPPVQPPARQSTVFQITEVFRLTPLGFEWLNGYGTHNFQNVPAKKPIGMHGNGELVQVPYDSCIVFPKVPSLWKEGAPLGWLAKKVVL